MGCLHPSSLQDPQLCLDGCMACLAVQPAQQPKPLPPDSPGKFSERSFVGRLVYYGCYGAPSHCPLGCRPFPTLSHKGPISGQLSQNTASLAAHPVLSSN